MSEHKKGQKMSRLDNIDSSYSALRRMIDESDEKEIVLQKRALTVMYLIMGIIGIRLHNTTIIWLRDNGSVMLNMTDLDGKTWDTVITRRRMSQFMQHQMVYREKGVTYVWDYGNKTKALYQDGMRLYPNGIMVAKGGHTVISEKCNDNF